MGTRERSLPEENEAVPIGMKSLIGYIIDDPIVVNTKSPLDVTAPTIF